MKLARDELEFLAAWAREEWKPACYELPAHRLQLAHGVAGTADRHERRQAGEWLRDVLARGPMEAKRLWDEARHCGLAERTVRRAAAELGLRPTKDGKSGTWFWGVGFPRVAPSPANWEALPEGDSAPSVAALPGVGSLAGEAVVQVELRREAAPSVATLPAVGSLAESAAAQQVPSSGEAAPSVAALPGVGSLAGEAVVQAEPRREAALPGVGSLAGEAVVQAEPRREAAPSVAALPPAGSLAKPEAPPPAAAQSARQRNRLTRRERRALERTMRICRDG